MSQPPPNIRTCQIIAAALMMGVLVFGGITLAMHFLNDMPEPVPNLEDRDSAGEHQQERFPVLLLVLFCLTGGTLIGRYVVLGATDRQLENELASDREPPLRDEDCLGRYQTRLIIGLALFEGPAFFALIVFMQEARWEAFGVAVGLLLMMALNFPTDTKFRDWVETARLNSGTMRGE